MSYSAVVVWRNFVAELFVHALSHLAITLCLVSLSTSHLLSIPSYHHPVTSYHNTIESWRRVTHHPIASSYRTTHRATIISSQHAIIPPRSVYHRRHTMCDHNFISFPSISPSLSWFFLACIRAFVYVSGHLNRRVCMCVGVYMSIYEC